LPAVNVPVQAAPQMQATSCLGTTITQWTFTGDVITPSTGAGTFVQGSGLPAPAFFTGSSGGADRAVSFDTWTTAATLDITDYIELVVPTVGRDFIALDFEYRATGTGPRNLEIHYSTDGTIFTLLGAPIALTRDATFHALSFDFSSISGLDDNANAIFRIYGYESDGSSGALRIDNIVFTGNCLIPGNTDTPTATNTPTSTGTPTNTSTATNTGTSTATAPTSTQTGARSIIINEVAWAGTAASTSDEWIELHNPGSSPINLAGWVLKAADGIPTIALTGTIPSGGYHLLERTDDNTVIDATASQPPYTGELENSTEILQLYDPTNRLIDTANSNGGLWPAGNSTTFNSMERRAVIADSDTAWITNVQSSTWTKHDARCTNANPATCSSTLLIRGTPGYGNWAFTVTPTRSPTPTPTRRPTATRTPSPLPPPPLVAINEFVPRPGHDWNNDGAVNVGDEYIEILNHGVINVNLSGYSLDDEVNIGSSPYRLPSVTIEPGQRIVFYGSETGLLLSDGGDGVRLLKPNGQLADAYNYFIVNYPDQSFCRLPDNGGLDDWNKNCFPTPGLQNSLSGFSVNPPVDVGDAVLCPIADTLPNGFTLAECPPFGNIWRPSFWDRPGWYGEKYLPESSGKWPVFAD